MLEGTISLGQFLAMLTVFGKVTGDFSSVYGDLLQLKKRAVVLQGLTRFFNMEQETHDLKDISERRCALAGIVRKQLLRNAGAARPKFPLSDTMVLEVRNVTLQYAPAPPLLSYAKASANQGSLICIAAQQSGAGRRSFMRAWLINSFQGVASSLFHRI